MNVTGNHDRVLPVWQVDQKRWLPLGERAVGLIAALMTIGAGLSGGTAVSRAVADFPEPLTQPTLWSIGLFVAAFLPASQIRTRGKIRLARPRDRQRS